MIALDLGLWRGQAASFSPLSLSPALWLDASDSTTLFQSNGGAAAAADGDPVGYWMDKSGNSNHPVQASGTNKPTLKTGANGFNSKNVLLFDGVNDWLYKSASLFGTTGTVFVVVSFNDNTSRNTVIDLKNIGILASACVIEQNTYNTSGQKYGFYTSNSSYDSNCATSSTKKIITMSFNVASGNAVSANTQYRVNGSAYTLTLKTGNTKYNATMVSVSGFMIGSFNNDGTPAIVYMSGKIAEIIVFNSIISGSNISNVESYLNSKWAAY